MDIKKIFKYLLMFSILIPLSVFANNKAVIDITKMDMSEISIALEQEIITSEELVSLYLARIDKYDGAYNSIITINEDAINQAKNLDKEREEQKVRSKIHGIPIIVKDNIDVLGMPTTAGAKALKDNFPKQSAFAIQKLIDAGAIILAKANMSEFAFYANSSRSSYGTVKNAYNIDYSSYGSSGGTAVAVAASFAAAGLGTDTNSSVRLPAAANNLVGLRPTVGLISRSGVIPYDPERDTIGPITKSVEDSILLMNIINGYDKNDKKSIEQENKNYKVQRNNLEGIIIGVPKDFIEGSNKNALPENQEIYSEIKNLVNKAISSLENSKAQIVYIDNYYTWQTDSWFASSLSGYKFCDAFNDYIQGTTGYIRSFESLVIASSKITPLDNYATDCNSGNNMNSKNEIKQKYQNYINNILEEKQLDVIFYPSTKNKLLKNGSSEKLQNLSAHASSTINYPTITLPLGFDSDNLPYGIEFMAPTWKEQLLFDIGAVYERSLKEHQNPEIAPSLYSVSKSEENLLSFYQKSIGQKNNYKFENKWQKKVKNYFRECFKNGENKKLVKELNREFKINNILHHLFNFILNIIKWILIIFSILVILLLIRKKIKKKLKKIRKLEKIRKKSKNKKKHY